MRAALEGVLGGGCVPENVPSTALQNTELERKRFLPEGQAEGCKETGDIGGGKWRCWDIVCLKFSQD